MTQTATKLGADIHGHRDLGRIYSSRNTAFEIGQETADANGSPVAIVERDGWYAVCEGSPDDDELAPLQADWLIIALIDPTETDAR